MTKTKTKTKYKLFIIMSFFAFALTSCNSKENINHKTIYIGAHTQPCNLGELNAECLQVKWKKDQLHWENFGQINAIQGFDFQAGFEYALLIKAEKVENPPADGASITYILVKEISKTKI